MAASASSSKWEPDPTLVLSSEDEIDAAYAKAKEVFASGMTKDHAWRKRALKNISVMLREHRDIIEMAITADMRRCEYEAAVFESSALLSHVEEAISGFDEATAPEHHSVPLPLGTASARVDIVPKGAVLIIGAWNYPAQLTIAPLIDAIAAGNTVVLKPSEVSPCSANAIQYLLERFITDGSVTVVQADKDGTTQLLEKRWDHIVYTGNSFVGRIVMKAAANHLTPVTLELGGKCPALVDTSANLPVACRRIAQARFANAGQTCLAVDYVLVDDAIHDAFVAQMIKTIKEFYTDTPKACSDFSRIINERHTRRIAKTIDDAKDKGANFVLGGDYDFDDCYVAPSIITDCPSDSILQQQETFGPLLLVQRVENTSEAIDWVNAGEKPLSLYIFSENSSIISEIQHRTLSGSVAVNDALVQKGVASAPFGGVGESGVGAYCGKRGIHELSHHRTVFTNPTAMDLPVRYPPYTTFSRNLIVSLAGYSKPAFTWRSAIPIGIVILVAALYTQGYFADDRIGRIISAFKW